VTVDLHFSLKRQKLEENNKNIPEFHLFTSDMSYSFIKSDDSFQTPQEYFLNFAATHNIKSHR
jgi:hypothetical protein